MNNLVMNKKYDIIDQILEGLINSGSEISYLKGLQDKFLVKIEV